MCSSILMLFHAHLGLHHFSPNYITAEPESLFWVFVHYACTVTHMTHPSADIPNVINLMKTGVANMINC